MNIAFILAVDEYTEELRSLPVCKRDCDAMLSIMKGSQKFERIIDLGGSSEGTLINKRFREEVQALEGEDIDELFFYFSGHGELEGDSVNLLLSDYSERRKSQTSLSTSLIDNAARELQPKFFVKLIDACNSGVAYVKRGDYISGYTSINKLPLNVFFGSSSLSREESFFSDDLSYFTEAIVTAVCDHANGEMKYYELAAAVKDFFSYRTKQTPLFIEQGVSNVSFCYVTDELKERLAEFLKAHEAFVNDDDGGQRPKTILDRLEAEAQRYASKDAVKEVMASFAGIMDRNLVLSDDLKGSFEFHVDGTVGYPPSSSRIGEWLLSSGAKYMAKPIFKDLEVNDDSVTSRISSVSRTAISSATDGILAKLLSNNRSRPISSYEITTSIKPTLYVAQSVPKLPSLPISELFVVPLLSQTMIALCYANTTMRLVDFDDFRRAASCSWHFIECEIVNTNEVENALRDICRQFVAYIEGPIRLKYAIT